MIDLSRLAFDKGLGQIELGKILKVAQSQVSLMMNGRRDIKQSHIDLLIKEFGEDVIKHYVVPDEVAEAFQKPQIRQVQASIISAEVIEEIKNEVRQEILATEQPIIIPDSIARKPNLDVLEWVESEENVTEHSRNAFNIADILTKTKFIVRTNNNAMAPTLFQNELVFMKPMHHDALITDGDIYGIDTKGRGLLIRKLYDKGDCILARPINRREYDDISIPKHHIIRRYTILFHGSTQLSSSSDNEPDLRLRDEMIMRLRNQLDKANIQLDKANERIDKLMNKLLE